jgi:hypothetical protein
VLTLGSFVLANGETIKITCAPGARQVRLLNVMNGIRHFQIGLDDELVATDTHNQRATTRCIVPPAKR